MIRILHTIDTTGPGGAETVFLNLVKGLNVSEYHSTVVIGGSGWVCDELKKIRIDPIFVNPFGAFNFRYLLSLVNIVRKHNIDIIHSHLFGANLYCCLAGLICRVPVVSTFHGFVDVDENSKLNNLKLKIIARGSSKIVCVSKSLQEHFIKQHNLPLQKLIVIFNGIDTSYFKPQRDFSIRSKLHLDTNDILVGAIGNLRPAKSYETLLSAARIVIDSNPRVRFVIAGDTEGDVYGRLQKMIRELQLENHVYFLGFVTETCKLLNNLDIYVLSSVSEGFSISTIEAMACGIPVVATRSGGPEEIIKNGLTGCLVPPRDKFAMANAILACLGSDIKTIIDASRRHCVSTFSADKMVNDYCSIYRTIHIIGK